MPQKKDYIYENEEIEDVPIIPEVPIQGGTPAHDHDGFGSELLNIASMPSGVTQIFYQATAPTIGVRKNDYWIDSDDNKIYRYSGTAWGEVQDDQITTAITNAATAQSTADGKIYVYKQTTAPSGLVAGDVGDLWLDSDDNDKVYRWSGSAWVESTYDVADWSLIVDDDGHKPDDDATEGATAGTDLKDSGATVLEDDEVKNMYDFTAGETIAVAKVVCYKKEVLDLQGSSGFTEDSYIRPATDDNYGSNTILYIDSDGVVNGCYVYMKPIVTDQPYDRAYLRVYGLVVGDPNVGVKMVTTTWDEDTITGNNEPTYLDRQAEGTAWSGILSAGWQWVEIEITNLVRAWAKGVYTNHGMQIYRTGDVGDSFYFRSKEYTTTPAQQPILRLVRNNYTQGYAAGGKVFLADKSAYNTARRILGITTGSAVADGSITVKRTGEVGGFSGLTVGAEYYLGDDGGIELNTFDNDNWKTKIGIAISATTIYLDVEEDRFIESMSSIDIYNEGGVEYIMCPNDANMAIIKYHIGGDAQIAGIIILTRNGINTANAQGYGNGGNSGDRVTITFTWDDTDNKITITNALMDNVNDDTTVSVVFYR